MDWKEIFKEHGLNGGRKLCAQYDFSIEKAHSPTIKIFVWELWNGSFYATTDHEIQNPGQGSPYRELNPHSTEEEALENAISAIKMFLKRPYDDIKFIPVLFNDL
jgi:hypothetical protein